MVGVAQSVRAPGCGPGGRGFESHHSPHLIYFQPHKLRFLALGCGQAVRHGTLDPAFVGSNPTAPAIIMPFNCISPTTNSNASGILPNINSYSACFKSSPKRSAIVSPTRRPRVAARPPFSSMAYWAGAPLA